MLILLYFHNLILPYCHSQNLLVRARDGGTIDHTSSDSTVCPVTSHDITSLEKAGKKSKTAVSREDKKEVVGVAKRNEKRPPLATGPVPIPCVVTPLTPVPEGSLPDLDISIYSGTGILIIEVS